jgi:ribosomal protein S18 acetylase RimI-like enzyme
MGLSVFQKGNMLKLYNNDTLIGKLTIVDTDQPGAWLSNFEINDKYRNAGNGSYLLNTAINAAKAAGCTAISLHCFCDNVDAIRFYFRHGFFIACSTTNIKNKCYLMVKQIA